MNTALITGITGQDGSYLAELLIEKNYQVIGLVSPDFNIGNDNIKSIKDRLILETGDLLDKNSLQSVFDKHQPTEVYNLAGLTFTPTSWEKMTLTLDINTLGVARLLEIIRTDHPQTKLYQASSSKIFGNPSESPQTETTPISPLDPYSTSKAAAHFLVQNARHHFDLFAVCGILFNHESVRRGPDFVTRKITMAAANIKLGNQDQLTLGDLKAQQDWGYAPDYVEAMWLMLQQDKPDDYIIASGQTHTVADICQIAFSYLDLDYQKFVVSDKKFVRKETINTPKGDYSKARKHLGWQPKITFEQMIEQMVEYDMSQLQT